MKISYENKELDVLFIVIIGQNNTNTINVANLIIINRVSE